MFKFLHAADLHLDSPMHGLGDYDGAPTERLRAAGRAALENLVKLAISERVRFVLLAGDVFDGDWEDYNTGLFFVSQLGRLREQGIPVFLISGNHDAASRMTRGLPYPNNVRTFPADQAQTHLLEDVRVALHGQSYAQQKELRNLAAGYPAARPGWLNIALLHTALDGRDLGFDVTIVTTATSNAEAKSLLAELGMPFSGWQEVTGTVSGALGYSQASGWQGQAHWQEGSLKLDDGAGFAFDDLPVQAEDSSLRVLPSLLRIAPRYAVRAGGHEVVAVRVVASGLRILIRVVPGVVDVLSLFEIGRFPVFGFGGSGGSAQQRVQALLGGGVHAVFDLVLLQGRADDFHLGLRGVDLGFFGTAAKGQGYDGREDADDHHHEHDFEKGEAAAVEA